MEMTGLSISLFTLLVSLFIFCYFRYVRCLIRLIVLHIALHYVDRKYNVSRISYYFKNETVSTHV